MRRLSGGLYSLRAVACSIALLAASAVTAQAQTVLFTNFKSGFGYNKGNYWNVGAGCTFGSVAIAVQFQPSATANFEDAVLPLAIERNSGTQVFVYLTADSADSPGAVIEGPLEVTVTSTSPSVFTVASHTFPLLQKGVFYWLVLDAPGANVCARWYQNSTGDVDLATNFAFSDSTDTPPDAWMLDAQGFGEDTRPAFEIDGTKFDPLLISYAANFGSGPSNVNLTNSGAAGANDLTDLICANVYVFAQDQQLISCCACPVSPNDLQTVSVQNDLIANTLTHVAPNAVTIALVPTEDFQGNGPHTCNPGVADSPVPGLLAWSTTPHPTPGGAFRLTELPFLSSPLSPAEYLKMTEYCAFIQADGTNNGLCGPCRAGAAGAQKQ